MDVLDRSSHGHKRIAQHTLHTPDGCATRHRRIQHYTAWQHTARHQGTGYSSTDGCGTSDHSTGCKTTRYRSARCGVPY